MDITNDAIIFARLFDSHSTEVSVEDVSTVWSKLKVIDRY